ncbi:hypothetical protein QUB70_27680 [Microcoleus sp. A003_D6]|uniref:hypothetical protein n=1 Tax=Microcoleus sp. A003_D6 TaxID=3055266 RepID=UPI002FCFB362
MQIIILVPPRIPWGRTCIPNDRTELKFAVRNASLLVQRPDIARILRVEPQASPLFPDIRLEKASIARIRDLRFEIKKLCDRSAIGGQRVISSVSQYSSFYSK